MSCRPSWLHAMNRRGKFILSIAAIFLLVLLAAGAAWLKKHRASRSAQDALARGQSASSERAFQETYLNLLAGRQSLERRDCTACHDNPNVFDQQTWNLLSARSRLSRDAWAGAIQLQARCGSCHATPDPATLPSESWIETLAIMARIADKRNVPRLSETERLDVLHYYFAFSPENLPMLAPDPDPAHSPLKFERSVFGNPAKNDPREHPVLGHVQIVDLDRDGQLDVLVCDSDSSRLTWIHRQNGSWKEETLANLPAPARTQILTNTANGSLNIVVACQSKMAPSDDPIGSVVLLSNDGKMRFTPGTILKDISRVADVEPGDFDGDGDLDFVVAAYGLITQGEIGWLEQLESGQAYAYHPIIKRSGAADVPPVDLNGDGRLDFVALFGQEHEQISAFINDGHGGFQEQVLFKAITPSFGSSGITLVDLDQDGDLDILYTNGDNMDLPTMRLRPYHGVQWLENKGRFEFVWHNIHRFYGAYCAVPGDLDNDGNLDIVLTSMFNDWADPTRASLIWLRNNGHQQFAPFGIARQPISLISAALGDLNQDGWLDIVACGMHVFPPFDRNGRVTLWSNRAATK